MNQQLKSPDTGKMWQGVYWNRGSAQKGDYKNYQFWDKFLRPTSMPSGWTAPGGPDGEGTGEMEENNYGANTAAPPTPPGQEYDPYSGYRPAPAGLSAPTPNAAPTVPGMTRPAAAVAPTTARPAMTGTFGSAWGGAYGSGTPSSTYASGAAVPGMGVAASPAYAPMGVSNVMNQGFTPPNQRRRPSGVLGLGF